MSRVKLPSPQERLELILVALAKQETVESLCRQAGVSRELFYRWMRAVRQAGLRALEAKAPGPKSFKEASASEVRRLKERLDRLEKDSRRLRRERDRFQELTEVAQRIIRRNAWGPFPTASKKNGNRTRKPVRFTNASGPSRKNTERGQESSPDSGGSAGAPIGGGSRDESKPSGAAG